jgi:hypothetical protein
MRFDSCKEGAFLGRSKIAKRYNAAADTYFRTDVFLSQDEAVACDCFQHQVFRNIREY